MNKKQKPVSQTHRLPGPPQAHRIPSNQALDLAIAALLTVIYEISKEWRKDSKRTAVTHSLWLPLSALSS